MTSGDATPTVGSCACRSGNGLATPAAWTWPSRPGCSSGDCRTCRGGGSRRVTPGSAPDVLGSLVLTLAMSVPFCWRRAVPGAGARAGTSRCCRSGQRCTGTWSPRSRRCWSAPTGWAPTRAPPAGMPAGWAGWPWPWRWSTVTFSHGDRLAAVPFALLAAALVLGDAASARRAETAAAVEAAHQAERTRIARELHDVVAHQLSAIAVQAGAARIGQPTARSRVAGKPAQVLATVEQLAREALTELNHLLGALRREPADDPTRPPAPTLAELAALLASARVGRGTRPSSPSRGRPEPCPPASSCPATASSPRRWPTWPGTRPARRPGCCFGYQADALGIEVGNGAARQPHRPRAPRPGSGGRGCGACGNGPNSTAAASYPGQSRRRVHRDRGDPMPVRRHGSGNRHQPGNRREPAVGRGPGAGAI